MNQHIADLQKALGLRADGIRGPVTTAEVLDAADKGRLMVKAAAPVAPALTVPAVPLSGGLRPFKAPAYADLPKLFGVAGGPLSTSGRAALPFPFRIAWDLDAKITMFSCHSLLAPYFTAIWRDAAAHYGELAFRGLGLDLFGGCFNHRNMRGGDKPSVHSWGAAQDVDPERNQLRWGAGKATLARAEYEPFWNIVESYGAVSLGRARNYDWMHFQFCKS